MARKFLLALSAGMFIAGFLFGYFIQGSTLTTAQEEIEALREDITNLQTEQLFLSQSPERSCPIVAESAYESSVKLSGLIESFGGADPSDESFQELKREADVLSIKSWILTTIIEDHCSKDITTALFIYSDNCEKCIEQDQILRDLKNSSFLVYGIDYNTDERTVKLVKGAYQIKGAPALVIKGETYGFLSKEEIAKILSDIKRPGQEGNSTST